jgi:hypothetical protein
MPSGVNSPTVRAAIYARFSSYKQRDASIEDQVEVCRRYAELQGWKIVKVYPRPCAERCEVGSDPPSSRCRWMPKRAGST